MEYNRIILNILMTYLNFLTVEDIEGNTNYFIIKRLLNRNRKRIEKSKDTFSISFYDEDRTLNKQYLFNKYMSITEYVNNISDALNHKGYIKIEIMGG